MKILRTTPAIKVDTRPRDISKDILQQIVNKYPKGSTVVTPEFARELFHQIEPVILRKGSDGTLNSLESLYVKSQKGISAADLHRSLTSIIALMDDDRHNIKSENNINRIEQQLNDLRMMVTAPTDIDRKLRDLQTQFESMKNNIAEDSTYTLEKQEDMLQKFKDSEKKAFIIMPFQRDFDNVWLGAIKSACAETHYAPLRMDEVNLSTLITEDIEQYVELADVVIVDLTGNNPNVMFELGWALAKDKKPIVICQGDHTSKVSFDVRGIRHISYENTWLGVEDLKKKIKSFITTTAKQPQTAKPKKTKINKK